MSKEFRNYLSEESTVELTEEILDFITSAEVVELNKYDQLVGYDQVCKDVFFVKSGCIQGQTINSDGRERTVGFGLVGSMIYSAHSFTMGSESVYRFSACCPTQLYRISNQLFRSKLRTDHAFCLWILGALEQRVLFTELRNEGLNGDAAFKYQWLRSKRPEILQMVPDKIIASYLNITEVHLSRIKRQS